MPTTTGITAEQTANNKKRNKQSRSYFCHRSVMPLLVGLCENNASGEEIPTTAQLVIMSDVMTSFTESVRRFYSFSIIMKQTIRGITRQSIAKKHQITTCLIFGNFFFISIVQRLSSHEYLKVTRLAYVQIATISNECRDQFLEIILKYIFNFHLVYSFLQIAKV